MKKVALVLLALVSFAALGKEPKPPTKPVSEINKFAQMMQDKYQFDKQEIKDFLLNTDFVPEIYYHRAPADYVKPTPEELRAMYLKRIDDGVQFWLDHEETLKRAEAEFGVPQTVLVALLGVETNYGNFQGRFKAADTLVTLGFYSHTRRQRYFRSELEHLLVTSRELKWNLDAIVGSYAGAIGMPQFMPSNVLKLAVDYDHDGKVDLINSPDDAIGSVGNYLAIAGWDRAKPIIVRSKNGYRRTINFTVIKRYNPLNSYVLEINRLSEQIIERRATYVPPLKPTLAPIPVPVDEQPLPIIQSADPTVTEPQPAPTQEDLVDSGT